MFAIAVVYVVLLLYTAYKHLTQIVRKRRGHKRVTYQTRFLQMDDECVFLLICVVLILGICIVVIRSLCESIVRRLKNRVAIHMIC